jgi:hypothetical protein
MVSKSLMVAIGSREFKPSELQAKWAATADGKVSHPVLATRFTDQLSHVPDRVGLVQPVIVLVRQYDAPVVPSN